jgi:hypothetical protein
MAEAARYREMVIAEAVPFVTAIPKRGGGIGAAHGEAPTVKKSPAEVGTMAGLWGNQRWRSCVAAAPAQCRTLDIWRKGSAGAAFERKVFT